MNQLEDIHWVETYADLGAEAIAKILGCPVKDANVAIHNTIMSVRAKTDIEMEIIRDIFPEWNGTLLAMSLGRHRRSIAKWAKDMKLVKQSRTSKGFWDMWRTYVQANIINLLPLASHIVIRPGEKNLECTLCTHTRCDFRQVLPCENLTLWDLQTNSERNEQ